MFLSWGWGQIESVGAVLEGCWTGALCCLEVWEIFFALTLWSSHTGSFQAPENEEFDLKLKEGLVKASKSKQVCAYAVCGKRNCQVI